MFFHTTTVKINYSCWRTSKYWSISFG